MESIYTFIGRAVVWGLATFIIGVALVLLWRRIEPNIPRRIKNAGLWIRVFIFRRYWHMPLEAAVWLCNVYQRPKTLDRWERDIIARVLRWNRRVGWKDPYGNNWH